MLILEMPRFYRLLKKTRIKEYRRGWTDCSKENAQIITRLRDEKIEITNEHLREGDEIRKAHKSEVDETRKILKADNESIRDECERSRLNRKKRTALYIQEKTKEHRQQLDYVKAEAQKRIDEIKEIAKEDIRKANEREEEYQRLIAKLKLLFHEGSAKFLITAQEQESLMNDMAKTIHRKNEFAELRTEFDKTLDSSNKAVNALRTKRVDAN